MIKTGHAEALVIGKGLRARWAATTSSFAEREMPDVSASSDAASHSGHEMLLAIVAYVRSSYALPHHSGIALLYEAPEGQVGLFENVVGRASSTLYPTVGVWNALANPPAKSYGRSLPSPASTEDLLDWDVAIQTAPPRPSRRMSVTLRYRGRSIPSPVADPSDE
jgi:hypothetical protein